jgi:lysophospholipase L1-like esterase
LPAPPASPRLGVLAFGDSITNGGGELQWGVALQSWALWVARGLGVPYTGCAVDGARGQVMADHVHPTAFGQIAIAEWALAVLAADGLPTRVRPHTLVRYETSWRGRLRGDTTYVYRHAKISLRAAYVGLRAASMRL